MLEQFLTYWIGPDWVWFVSFFVSIGALISGALAVHITNPYRGIR